MNVKKMTACVALALLVAAGAHAGWMQCCQKPYAGGHSCTNPGGACSQWVYVGGCVYGWEVYCTAALPGTSTTVTYSTGGTCQDGYFGDWCAGYSNTSATITLADRC